MAHHLLLSHGAAVEAYRTTGSDAPIGITLSLSPIYPQRDTDADRRAAALCDAYVNRWYLDPVFQGATRPTCSSGSASATRWTGSSTATWRA